LKLFDKILYAKLNSCKNLYLQCVYRQNITKRSPTLIGKLNEVISHFNYSEVRVKYWFVNNCFC